MDLAPALDDLRATINQPAPTSRESDNKPPETRSQQSKSTAIATDQLDDDAPIPQPSDRPRIELLDEQPLLMEMDDEDIDRWLNEMKPMRFDPDGLVSQIRNRQSPFSSELGGGWRSTTGSQSIGLGDEFRCGRRTCM